MALTVANIFRTIFIITGILIGLVVLVFIIDEYKYNSIKPKKEDGLFRKLIWNVDIVGRYLNKQGKNKYTNDKKQQKTIEEIGKKKAEEFDEARDQQLKQKPLEPPKGTVKQQIQSTVRQQTPAKPQEVLNSSDKSYMSGGSSSESEFFSESMRINPPMLANY